MGRAVCRYGQSQPLWCFFEPFVLIYALFDEYTFERGEMQLFAYFAKLNHEIGLKDFLCRFNTATQNVTYRKEVRLVVVDYAAVGGNGKFAVGKSVKCINGFVA